MEKKIKKYSLVVNSFFIGCGNIVNIRRNGNLIATNVLPILEERELKKELEKMVDIVILHIEKNES